jgi:hypothetical protein
MSAQSIPSIKTAGSLTKALTSTIIRLHHYRHTYTSSDSISDASAQQQCSEKLLVSLIYSRSYLAECRDKRRLSEGQTSRTHGCREGICNVVCANVESISKGKYNAERKDICILWQSGGHGQPKYGLAKRTLSYPVPALP